VAGHGDLASILLTLLDVWRSMRLRAAELSRQLVADARQSRACQLLMSIPGVGAVTATSFATAIEDPENFKKSRSVGTWIGLTPRDHSTGGKLKLGRITRAGDEILRSTLGKRGL
jgi:transposase